MLCKNPFVKDGRVYGCGQCMPCRFNLRRMWTHRIMLEAGCHEDNAFVTLTYADEFLPEGATLVKEHVQRWNKRLRKSVAPARYRFYCVGEYGDKSGRPHYHVALFGVPSCGYGRTRRNGSGQPRSDCCEWCNIYSDSWGAGSVDVGRLEISSAQYIAGYVTKKMTNANDPSVAELLRGREPEFCLRSNRPGIGVPAMDDVASTLLEFNLEQSQSDVPVTLQVGGRHFPLGRHLRRKLRERVGRDAKAPVCEEVEKEVRRLRDAQMAAPAKSLKQASLDDQKVRLRQFDGRAAIFKKEKKL